jgi:hypothetical protein
VDLLLDFCESSPVMSPKRPLSRSLVWFAFSAVTACGDNLAGPTTDITLTPDHVTVVAGDTVNVAPRTGPPGGRRDMDLTARDRDGHRQWRRHGGVAASPPVRR